MTGAQNSDYRKELERAAKQMILVHRVDALVKVILRTVIRIMRIQHTSLLLYDEARDAYVVYASRGIPGLKVPKGFARISKDNPVVSYFTTKKPGSPEADYLLLAQIEDSIKEPHRQIKEQFLLYNARACIPGFFRKKLIFALFLGAKHDGSDFGHDELGFLMVLSSDVVMAIQNARLFQGLNEQLVKNKNLFLQTVFALSSAIEAKDPYTQGHTERVTHYAQVIASELKVTGRIPSAKFKSFLENIRIASLLHDIGKIGVPEAVLNKKDTLDEYEYEQMKKHALIGANILNRVDEFHEPVSGVKYHHEKYDGTGYPDGLKGENIPLIARIISVADTYDAMTTDRPYRKALTRQEAMGVIDRERNAQFDPAVVDAFLSACTKGSITPDAFRLNRDSVPPPR